MLVMKMGILAAGAGSRLHSGGLHLPKPLLPIAGLPLIGHLLQAVQQLDIDEIVCIINTQGGAVADYVRQHYPKLPLTFVQQDTASSFESFTVLCEHLCGSSFLVTTVDTVFDAALLPQFVAAARRQTGVDMMLSLTRFIDDEKPLYVRLDEQQRIVQLGVAAHDSGIDDSQTARHQTRKSWSRPGRSRLVRPPAHHPFQKGECRENEWCADDCYRS